jgi:hypothetical protein
MIVEIKVFPCGRKVRLKTNDTFALHLFMMHFFGSKIFLFFCGTIENPFRKLNLRLTLHGHEKVQRPGKYVVFIFYN